MTFSRNCLAALALACMATAAPAQEPAELYTFDLVARPSVQKELKALMGAKALEEFEFATTVAGPVKREGGWIVGRGCRPHMCDEEFGVIAIHDDGTLIAVSNTAGDVRVHGNAAGRKLPKGVLDVMAGR